MGEEQQYIEILTDILKKQESTLCEILNITREQSRIVNETVFDENAFDDTLTRKDVCIMRLNELDDGFVATYDRVRKLVQSSPEMYRDKIKKMQNLIRSCTDLGNEIQTLENRNKNKVEKCFAVRKKEYNAKQAAATVANKYNTTMKNVNIMGEGYRFNQDK